MTSNLNQRALALCDEVAERADQLQVASHRSASGTTVLDFGVDVAGGQEAGILLARICLADLAEVAVVPRQDGRPTVTVATDWPVAACMASQYAGWEIKGEDYFAMGSGPMRAAAAREPLFDDIGFRQPADACVGTLESNRLPPDKVCVDIAEKCAVEPGNLTLVVAPTSSPAGTLQVVARSVETALHKLHELDFDLSQVVSGSGSAPLAPVAKHDLAAIGVTNDAILYGGQVTLQVRGDDQTIQQIGPLTPSSASADYGRPFAEVLAGYGNDFYQVDPKLFSAAQVTFDNLDTGNSFQFGQLNLEVLERSFGEC